MKRGASLNRAIALALLGGAGFARAQAADGERPWSVWTRAEAVGYSETVSVYGAFHELEGRFRRGDEAFTHNQIELGVSRGGFSLALIGRYDYHLNFDPDTAELAHRGENSLPLTVDRDYAIEGHVNHMRSTGLKLAYAFAPFDNLELSVALSYLVADELMHGSTQGVVSIDATGSYTGEAFVDYTYTEDVLLNRSVSEPEGRGFAVDAHARWRVGDAWLITLDVEDWYNEIHWDDAPFTEARLTSATSRLDENGFLVTVPLLSGFEGERDFTQQLPVRTTLDVRYAVNDTVELVARGFNVDSINLPELGVRYRDSAARIWSIAYGTESRAVTLGLESDHVQLSVGLDSFDHEEAHYAFLAFSFVHRW